jgi:hypothetical protein
VTVTERFTLPPAPVQLSVKVLVVMSGPRVSLPEMALLPDQASEAVQEVALVEDQVSVDDPPLVIDAGFAASDTVGTGGNTVTVADALAVPPGPVQARANVLVLVNAPLGWLPEIVWVPDHAPEARQEVALVEDQVSVEDPPLATNVGFAASDTVGTGGVTVTVADALAVPPGPVQARPKVLVLANATLDSLPEIAFVPDQTPEATQEVALVEDQVSVEVPPLVTDAGFAASDTVGTGGVTVTVADALAVPPAPVQARPNVLVLANATLDSLPEIAFVPDQTPEATQEVALVEDQVSVDDPPLVIDAGFAASDTVGPGGVTVTVADALAVPPGPVQARANVLVLANATLDSLPEIAFVPDHAPEARQEVALVEDQVSVEVPLLVNNVGFAASDTVGTGGGVPPWLLWALSPLPPQAAIMRHKSRRPNERVTVPHVPAKLDTDTNRSISFPRRR